MRFFRAVLLRIDRLILTLLSKQWLVFGLGTYLLIGGFITAEVWFMLAGVVIGVNVFQKIKGVGDGRSTDNDKQSA